MIRLPSTTTSSSTQSAPALRRSVCSDGHDVIRRPLTTSASTSTQGAWQIAATGLPASKNAFTNATASASARTKSPLMTPPGRTSAAVGVGVGRAHDGVDLLRVALVDVVVGGDACPPPATPAPAPRRPPRAPATAGPARPARRRPWPARPPSSRSVLLPCSAATRAPNRAHTGALRFPTCPCAAAPCSRTAEPLWAAHRAAGRRAAGSRTPSGSPGSWSATAAGSRSSTSPGRRTTPPRSSPASIARIHARRAGRRLRADPARRRIARRAGSPLSPPRRGWRSPAARRRCRPAPTRRRAGADDAGAEDRCRALAAGRVRLTEGRGARRRPRLRALPQRPHGRRTAIPRSPPPTGG